MENIRPTNHPEVSPSKPSPFMSSAKLVMGVGLSVLGVIGKAIKGAAGLLVSRPGSARVTDAVTTNRTANIGESRDS